MNIKKATIGMLFVSLLLSGCDPVYGGVKNFYPEPVNVKLYTNSPKVVNTLRLSAGQRFVYREPTKMLAINITTEGGKTVTYNSAQIDKIVLDTNEPNERISWALAPEGLFVDCIQHAFTVSCSKRNSGGITHN